MAKQLFVGPAMSGAPMHWHNTAMNALAYGRKHWYVLVLSRRMRYRHDLPEAVVSTRAHFCMLAHK